jgi:hypothetical protein
MYENWKKDTSGNFIVNPLVGCETVIAAETAICLKMDYLVGGDERGTPSGSLQLLVTPPQAQELAQALLKIADKVLQTRPTGKPS